MDLVRLLCLAALRVLRPVLLSAAVLLTTISSRAQDAGGTWKLSVPRGDHRNYFGSAISLDRSAGTDDLRALIGAPTGMGSGEVGSAHLFRLRDGEWVHEKELRGVEESAPLASPYVRRALKLSFGAFRVEWSYELREAERPGVEERFGSAVSLHGETALVAAPWQRVVRVFRDDGTDWIPDGVLSADGDPPFGYSVSVWEGVALIGNGRGKAYVFRRTDAGWEQEAELRPGGRQHRQFGQSVSLYEDTALVGAPEGYDFFAGNGRAYVFRYDGSVWIEEAVLQAPDGRRNDRFGGSVSLSRDACIIGAVHRGRGAAYVFRHDGERWALEQEWMGTGDDYQFGDSVSIDGDHAIVGVPHYGSDHGGAAYVYRRDGEKWVEARKIVASDPGSSDFFGKAVSMGGGYAAAGAPNNDCDDACYGSVYVGKLPTERTRR